MLRYVMISIRGHGCGWDLSGARTTFSQSDLALFLVPVRFAEGFRLAAVFQAPIIDCCRVEACTQQLTVDNWMTGVYGECAVANMSPISYHRKMWLLICSGALRNMCLIIFKFTIIFFKRSLSSYGLQKHLRHIKNQVCQLFMDYKNNYGAL